MLRTGQLRRAPPRPRDLARRRECCYRGPWRLPGPDSHRLAAVSLALGYPLAPPFVASAPELLDAHSVGITDGMGCGERSGHAAVLAAKPDAQLTGGPTAADRPDYAGLLPGCDDRALLAGAGDRPAQLEKGGGCDPWCQAHQWRSRACSASAGVAFRQMTSMVNRQVSVHRSRSSRTK